MNGFSAPPSSYQPRGDERLPPLSLIHNPAQGQREQSQNTTQLPPISAAGSAANSAQQPPGYQHAYQAGPARSASGSQMPPPTLAPQHSSAFPGSDNKNMNMSQAGPSPSQYAYMPPYSSASQQSFQPAPANHPPGPGGPGQYYPAGQPPFDPNQRPDLLPPFQPQPHGPPQPVAANGLHLRPADRPVPVVGSQGRRGILPSASGRPSALAPSGGGNALSNVIRRSDGKYECQFCSKSYLHLKHLKRHHLRHTGERPYQCYLCQETFCRSDILKRHFQKCSIRRGNPTGATHLTHAQAHLRRGPPQGGDQMSSAGSSMANGGPSAPPSSYRPGWPGTGANPGPDGNAESGRSSRSSSVVHRPASSADERKTFAGAAGQGPQTANTSLDTSPQSNGDDRKYAANQSAASFPQYSRELPATGFQETSAPGHLQQGPPQGYPSYYGGPPPASYAPPTSGESFPNFGYPPAAPNGYGRQYTGQAEHGAPMYNEQAGGYGYQYFQANGNDPVLGYHTGHQQ